MRQTWAIFLDAYRNLNSKWMFWAVLLISGLVVACFAGLGINEHGLKVFLWQIDLPMFNTRTLSAATFYKQLFVHFGIGLWLSWIGTILALISTAGMFPDLLTSGSVDLLVSKPIGRLRLFLTEYAAGLLFVTLQAVVFTSGCFLLIGLRGGEWEPGLYLAVPIVVCFFSYLFSFCVFLGVLTRSTLASLLLTLLFWFLLWGLGAAEEALLAASHPRLCSALELSPRDSGGLGSLQTAHRIVYGVKTVLPKTTETIALLERSLVKMAELPQTDKPPSAREQAQRELVGLVHSRSLWWVVGSSLLFEGLLVAAAASSFCRRSF